MRGAISPQWSRMIRLLRAKRLLLVLALATLFARCAAAQGLIPKGYLTPFSSDTVLLTSFSL